jgi:hypothetical protein
MAVEDKELLRSFEPVLRFTKGEHFFPTDVNSYVKECSLWAQRKNEPPQCILVEGEVTLDTLAEVECRDFGTTCYLQFIEPANLAEVAAYRLQQVVHARKKVIFKAGRGRLARVGYASRFIDALFSFSLLARGRVPGDTAIAATIAYEKIRERQKSGYPYYGRVLHHSGWTVLQYWYFYAFNNWRSGFFGVNDHEADWEMVSIYLYETENDELRPEWVAYASHDHSGDDLRRRWDDPEVEKKGTHPIVYVGAGSHASYYSSGEYLTQIEIPFLTPLVRLSDALQRFSGNLLKKTQLVQEDDIDQNGFNIFRIPFVDYARGEGFSIGDGAMGEWADPVLIEPAPPWVGNYRGLWGFFARDPVSGENAPAGVRYNRDGSVRKTWYSPLGWAGLDKVPSPRAAFSMVDSQVHALERERQTLSAKASAKQQDLFRLGLETNAMRYHSHLQDDYVRAQESLEAASDELDLLKTQIEENYTMIEVNTTYRDRLNRGEKDALRNHIKHAQQPETAKSIRMGRFAETWSAVSIGITIIGIVLLALFGQEYLIFGLVQLIALVVFIEAGFRRQLSSLIKAVTIALTVVGSLVILYEFFWTIIVIVVLIAGGYMIWENLRELWS